MIRSARAAARLLIVLSPLLAAASWTEPVHAQDDVATQMARERFQEGVRFYDQKQYEKARAAFLQAYALRKHPAVLLNLAQSELRAKHEADAAKHFAQYLREASATGAERAEAEKGLAAAKAAVGEFTVTVELEGSEVYVDGNFEGRSPLPGPIYLSPGDHNLEARRDGRTAAAAVNATAGQTSSIALSFSNPGGATAPVTGPMVAPPGTQPSPGPGPGPQPPPGDQGSIGFDTSEKRRPFFEWAAETPVAWVGGGVTALGLIGGVAFALSSSSNFSSADSIKNKITAQAAKDGVTGPCGPPPVTFPTNYTSACTSYQDRVDTAESQKTLTMVSFIVAGVAAAGTVGYYFIDAKEKPASARKPRAPRTALVPLLGPGTAGLGFAGEL